MQELASGIGAIKAVVESGGPLAIVIGIAWYFWKQSEGRRKELVRTYRRLNKEREIAVRFRAHLDANKVTVDIADIETRYKEEAAEDAAQA